MKHATLTSKWWTLAVVGSGTFMSALDTSVVNVALPVISRETGATVASLEWVMLAYLIVVSSSLLAFGRLADIHGKRRIYLMGIVIFTLGSLACSLSRTIGLLIASRALQALGTAMLFALSPALLVAAFPASERGRALGIQATLTYLGLALGPPLGGFLTQHFGWPTIFSINVPIGLAMWGLALVVLHPDRNGAGQPFDPIGAGAMAIGLAATLFALSKGGEMGWRHPLIITAALTGLLALVALLICEQRCRYPALDLKLFRNRRFAASMAAAWLSYVCAASLSFLMPFRFLLGAGWEPARVGVWMMAVPVGMVPVAALSGYVSDKVGVTLPATLGMLLVATGNACLAGFGVESPALAAVFLALTGLGAGLFTAPNNSAIMGSAPAARHGVAGAMLAAARTTGFASGIAMAGLIYMTRAGHTSTPVAADVVAAVHNGLWVTAGAALLAALGSLLRGPRHEAV
ncbi:MAG TPA: DHA2 family efflux MFS transporter permease subunit [Kiritimatiellia bacterium]|nr:DHA2 family efflux MFS transporter permease subunit [Kiritimatiellia bacterium]